jgi:hypothetical protein
VAAIAAGTIQAEDAKAQADAIRRRIEDTELAIGRLRFDRRRMERLEREGERLVEMARDFRTTATRLSGTDLRELLRPWIHSAVVDKHARQLVLEVRPIPADVSLFTPARRDEQAGTVRRVIPLKSRSEWATIREAVKRSRQAS